MYVINHGETLAETIVVEGNHYFPPSVGAQSFAHGFAHLIRLPDDSVWHDEDDNKCPPTACRYRRN
jgi:hypothetical protein